MNADILVTGDYVLPIDGEILRDSAVAIKDGKILAIGASDDLRRKYDPLKELGGKGKAVMPAFVNTHTHAAMVYMRGMADDLPLMTWLQEHIWPVENKWLSPEFAHDAVELACLEMIRAGVTTFCDMYFFSSEAAEVVKRMGMRAILCAGVIDMPTKTTSGADDCLENAEAFIQKFKGDEQAIPGIALHSIYTCGPDTIRKTRALAEKHDILVSIHLAEAQWEVGDSREKFGVTPAIHLDNLGLLDQKLLAAHCVWLNDEEIELFAKKNVGISHCIESNLKLASGIAPVAKMLKAGIKVGLGTDGAASNNDLDILGEIATAAKVHKGVTLDPTVIDARTALTMGTRMGAEAMGISGLGVLTQGARADVVVMDINKPHLAPVYNICSQVVYSSRSSDIETVISGGRILMQDGKVTVVDEGAVLEKARMWGMRLSAKEDE